MLRPLTVVRPNVVTGAPFAAVLLEADTDRDVSPAVRRRLPQTIAHRGYKAVFPENTLVAFRSAIEIGAHAIETDLHMSKDGVVVLCHDSSLKRCFGIDAKIADCEWRYLSTLRTLREPRQPIPRLVDLLEYLAQPGLENIWVLLDVKRDDDGSELLSGVAAACASVPTKRAWSERLVMGCWTADYVSLCLRHLPGFPFTYIGWSLTYARELLPVPNMNFNMLQYSLVGPCGTRFLKDVRKAGRLVFVWTVNDEAWMEWSIRKGLDGVITDDPKLFLEVCKRRDNEDDSTRSQMRLSLLARQAVEIAAFQVFSALLALYMLTAVGTPRKHAQKALQR
ncbi:PLC-like phosphodiesterase [Pseudomassariella vexata]|uniref:PLC-like phosphodiesterase n=1 Tax=Pseudomassariella vexata TaxID=1141098 RepID=A0A1Y2DV11_9PEZI|nr:PLC-like phosphodiesterase [Pseudomassariella vexata]ORY63029.1 PLC-like phosphodiesterase [Pseudomassariella vexata]